MRIESLRLRNFKTFRDIHMKNIPSLCVVVGANGTGKSTLFGVFGFLKDCLTYNVKRALDHRGGFDEVISRNAASQTIYIELQFRMEIAQKNRLCTYVLEIGKNGKSPCIKREVLEYKRGEHGSPFHFLDFKNGEGYAILNEEDYSQEETLLKREFQKLDSDDILAIKGLGQFERFKAASAFRTLIENWHISDFHISDARSTNEVAGYEEHLSDSGDNLKRVARFLYENHPDIFKVVKEKMKARVPGVADISTELTKDGRLLLQFGDSSFKEPFIDRYVSDGTMKMFAYLVLLHDPKPFPVLCVEEPENQLYPKLLTELAEEFQDYAERGGQVFVSTHSPDFLNAVGIESVFWLVKRKGYSEIRRANDDPQLRAFMAEGDKMGHLWKEGFFEGADPE